MADDEGNLLTSFPLNGEVVLENEDGSPGASFLGTDTGVNEFRRGVVLAKYSGSGDVLYAKRFGNAVVDPAGKTYNAPGLTRNQGAVRVSGFTAGNGAIQDQSIVFGEGELDEETRTINERSWYAYTAAFDPMSGNYLPDSLRLTTHASVGAGGEVRFSANGTGAMADDGSYLQAVLVPDIGTHLLNFGQTDQTSQSTTQTFTGFLVRFDDLGQVAWSRQISDIGGLAFFAMASDGAGNTFVSGVVGAGNFGIEDGVGTTTVAGPRFWASYDVAGDLRWVRSQSANLPASPFYYDDELDALFALGAGDGPGTFGVGDGDALDVDLGGRSSYLARIDPATGGVLWVRLATPNDTRDTPFRSITRLGSELIVGTRFLGNGRLEPGTPNELRVGSTAFQIWSGSARYGLDGTFLSAVEYVVHGGVQTLDGLVAHTAVEP